MVSDSFVLLLIPLTCQLLCQWKAGRELRKVEKKEGKKERDEDTFLNSNSISGFDDHSVGAKIFPETDRNSHVSLTKYLNILELFSVGGEFKVNGSVQLMLLVRYAFRW